MALAGPMTYVDHAATPTTHNGAGGSTWQTWPPLAGVFYITDAATYERSADVLEPYRVEPALPLQAVMAGDDPAAPAATVTLCFPDAETAAPIVEAVNALPPVAAQAPASPAPSDRAPSSIDFLRRFTMAERIAIRGRRKTDPIVDDFLDLLDRVTRVQLDNADTQAGLGYMVAQGLLTADRAAEILA